MNFLLFWTLKLGFPTAAAPHIPDRGSWPCCLTLSWLCPVSSPACAQPLVPAFCRGCCCGSQLPTAPSDSTCLLSSSPLPTSAVDTSNLPSHTDVQTTLKSEKVSVLLWRDPAITQ